MLGGHPAAEAKEVPHGVRGHRAVNFLAKATVTKAGFPASAQVKATMHPSRNGYMIPREKYHVVMIAAGCLWKIACCDDSYWTLVDNSILS